MKDNEMEYNNNIKNQLQSDQIAYQISLEGFVDPFTGSVDKKA